MTLRSKVLLILASMWAVILVIIFINEGLKTIYHYLGMIITIGILVIISVWYLLKKFILDRILSISEQVISINSESNFSKRIKITGNDELTSMVSVMNLLMEIIELTQEQLKYRILQRTEQLDRLSMLNKNLSNEINYQKNIELKLKENEQLFRQLAYYDVLTGLPNRIFFTEHLQKIIERKESPPESFAILFIDVDKLKFINDTYGHDIGDAFIRYTAQNIKNTLDTETLVARLAGDEFILIIKFKDREEIDKIAETVLKNVAVPMKLENTDVQSTSSIGISIYPNDGLTAEVLQKNADLAMYYAKKLSGNAYCYFDKIKQEISSYMY